MASFSTFAERIDAGARLLVPYGFMALLFILNVVAISYPLSGAVKAPLFLMGIYYWALYRPTLFPIGVVFAAGLLLDLFSGLPLGLNALVFVLVQWSVRDQRRFLMGQPFMMVWIGFVLLSAATGLLQWVLFGIAAGLSWPPLYPLCISVAFGAAMFPFVCIVLHLTHKLLPAPHPAARFSSQTHARPL